MTSKSLHPNQSKIMSYIRLRKYLLSSIFFQFTATNFLKSTKLFCPSPSVDLTQ